MTYIKLDDLELIKRVDNDNATAEIRSVHSVSISGRRNVVEHKIPGSKGNVFQDLGRDPLMIKIDGRLIGNGSTATLNEIRAKFESGEPVAFASDIGSLEEVSKVVVENLTIQFIGGLPNGTSYSLMVREFSPQAQKGKEEGAQSQDAEAEEDIKCKTQEVRQEGSVEGEAKEAGEEEEKKGEKAEDTGGKEEGGGKGAKEEGGGKEQPSEESQEVKEGGTQEQSGEDGKKEGGQEKEEAQATEPSGDSGSDQVSEQKAGKKKG